MTYNEQRATLIAYLKAKVEIADWHGVSDAANDLRVLEAQQGATPGRTVCAVPSKYSKAGDHWSDRACWCGGNHL